MIVDPRGLWARGSGLFGKPLTAREAGNSIEYPHVAANMVSELPGAKGERSIRNGGPSDDRCHAYVSLAAYVGVERRSDAHAGQLGGNGGFRGG